MDIPVPDTARPDLRAELEQHHADCVGWALSCCAWDRSEADDVLQASYLKVLDGRAVYRERSSFKTWMFGVIRLTSAEHRRRGAVRRLITGEALIELGMTGSRVDPAAEVERADESARLVRSLGVLPRRQRELLHLVFYQNLTIQEAAGVLAISIGSARTHYERGKKRLRELLGMKEQP